MDTPYRVERTPKEYEICRHDEVLVKGKDSTLLYRICELLNEDAKKEAKSERQ